MHNPDARIQRFWGRRSLGVAFLIYMFKKKLARPSVPLHCFLISRGYKTYLLMANNFNEPVLPRCR